MRYWILTFLVILAAPALAEDFIGVRPMGMGEAHRAVVTSNDAIQLNPAGMSIFRRYSFEVEYLYSPELGIQNGPPEHVFHASVVDNQLQAFATGLAYTRVEREDQKSGNRFDLALSFPLGENLLLGTNIKYLSFDWTQAKDVDAVTVDVGLLMRSDIGLALGLVGYNLTNPADYLEHPMSMAVAAMYSPIASLEIAIDWFINFQRPTNAAEPLGEKKTAYSFHFGAEYLLMDSFTLRAGFIIDNARAGAGDKLWAAGIGYLDPAFAIDFGYRGSIEHTSVGTLGFALRMFL